MTGMLSKSQSFILYKHFLFLINLPYLSDFINPFLKYLVKKIEKTFYGDQPLSAFHRFLNAKFSDRLYFTWTLFEKHIMYYSVLPYYILTTKV